MQLGAHARLERARFARERVGAAPPAPGGAPGRRRSLRDFSSAEAAGSSSASHSSSRLESAHGRNGARRESPRQHCVKRRRADVLLSRRSGSPEDTDLERISLAGPRIKDLRNSFVIESGAQLAITNSLCVNRVRVSAGINTVESRSSWATEFWRASAVTASSGTFGFRRTAAPHAQLV